MRYANRLARRIHVAVRSKRCPARERLAEIKQAYAEDPDPSFATWGPRDVGEFLALHALSQGKV